MWTPNASPRVWGRGAPPHTPPYSPQGPALDLESVAVDGSPEPGPRDLRGPILGYEESSSQSVLTCSTVPRFPPSQLQAPEHTKGEHSGERSGDEC